MKKYLFLALVPVMFSGCANLWHTKVEDGELATRAAFALNVSKSAVKISDRSESGTRIDFTATVKGHQHSCYVTAASTYAGRTVTDAICSGGHATEHANSQKSCNALQHAAGKC